MAAFDDNPHTDEGEAELSLGWTEQEARLGRHAAPADVDTQSTTPTKNPALQRRGAGQSGVMAAGGRSDVEGDEHDGREPDVEDEDGADTEPRFGWNDEGGGARPLQPHGQPGAVMTAEGTKLPLSDRAAARRPRRSKNGTPEERAPGRTDARS